MKGQALGSHVLSLAQDRLTYILEILYLDPRPVVNGQKHEEPLSLRIQDCVASSCNVTSF